MKITDTEYRIDIYNEDRTEKVFVGIVTKFSNKGDGKIKITAISCEDTFRKSATFLEIEDLPNVHKNI